MWLPKQYDGPKSWLDQFVYDRTLNLLSVIPIHLNPLMHHRLMSAAEPHRSLEGVPGPSKHAKRQLLHTLSLTRKDLHCHRHQMRQFLTAEHANSVRALSFSQEHNDLPEPLSARQSFKSFSSVSHSKSARDAPQTHQSQGSKRSLIIPLS
jgi:hypothetical protein